MITALLTDLAPGDRVIIAEMERLDMGDHFSNQIIHAHVAEIVETGNSTATVRFTETGEVRTVTDRRVWVIEDEETSDAARRFATWDAALKEIAAAIEGSGTVENAAAEYDLEAIADDVLTWDDGHDPETGNTRLDRQGWRIIEGDAFWRAVERHEYKG